MDIQKIKDSAKTWLTPSFDTETQKAVQHLIDKDSQELIESFYKDLEFGTGGMRGIMGAGINRINKYTLGRVSQGLINYLQKKHPNKQCRIVIAYDCRKNSDTLAKTVADVFTANGVKVFLFENMRPTPELSFAVSHLNCEAGIVLTASHNPPEYNGYKVYGSDGAQVVTPEDGLIIEEVNKLDFSEIKFDAKPDLLEYIGKDIDKAFIKTSVTNTCLKLKNRNDLTIVFTSLHGTSITVMPQVFEQAGYKNVHYVEEQRQPDGNFPTVESPNPEEPAALKMALELAEKVNADILIGTDPDSDRLGIAVRDLEGHMRLLNGNQTMSIMTSFLIKKWKKQGKLNGNQFVASTIVSTDMISEIANSYGVENKICLTGFKWIAKLIKDNTNQEFIGGGEESFGYMVGDYVRDKDAISATLLACEIASYAKQKGSTFYKELLGLYVKHDFYKEHLVAVVKKGMDGAAQIKQIMIDLRKKPLAEIDGEKVKYVYDYESSTKRDLITGKETQIDIPKSNVLVFLTEKGTKVAARPSGTEPKIKFYFSVNTPLESVERAGAVEQHLDEKNQRIAKIFDY
ncbi:phospho-sugar mutase [Tamlana sp. 2201CG12-4]|uniref:phospho-sugar mutase n=1 Tax=Tamlana sp. 2201CG12-4 TaxID=3112582 RepID=UPI002DB7935F|nr:phospho-sugar mutase [Tamlana sp. 2201CG12-4]MEC3906739.1 phospho-sugar mutase [Tamlana sp. 2201CG12-4]